MKILLDECLPLDFRHSFAGHQVHTAEYPGLKSKKNGDLFLRTVQGASGGASFSLQPRLQPRPPKWSLPNLGKETF